MAWFSHSWPVFDAVMPASQAETVQTAKPKLTGVQPRCYDYHSLDLHNGDLD